MTDSPASSTDRPAEPQRRGSLGIVVNPMAGRDVRRLAARARRETPEDKANQVSRLAIGSAAAGVERILVARDCFRVSQAAVENLRLEARIEFVEQGQLETKPSDTQHVVRAMRDAGCGAIVVLGGDGTNRVVAQTWPDAPLVPLSTGTNNVFPHMLEATVAGAGAGFVASGAVALGEVAQRAKCVRVAFDDGAEDLALIDAVLLEGDHIGSLLPFDPGQLRHLVLARAEPASVGTSPIGGLLQPCAAGDDFGVAVRCVGHGEGGRRLLAPLSPGLYRHTHVADVRKLALGERLRIEGPGVLAVDGDRIRTLAPGEPATLWVERTGPNVIDVEAALRAAGEGGLFFDRSWSDALDMGGGGLDCC